MKTSLLLSLVLLSVLSACSDDETTEPVVLTPNSVTDLRASSSTRFTFYNLRTNAVVTDSASTSWDIAFKQPVRGVPEIIVNGGTTGPGLGAAQLVDGIFDAYPLAPTVASGYSAARITTGWYTYTGAAPAGPQHAVLPTAGKLFVIKTADGKYAKLQILSIYQGNPDTSTSAFANFATRPSDGYFTFRFVVQPDGSANF